MSIQESIDTQRAFALNGKLKIEKSFSESLVKELSNLGHNIQVEEDGIGGGQGIFINRSPDPGSNRGYEIQSLMCYTTTLSGLKVFYSLIK